MAAHTRAVKHSREENISICPLSSWIVPPSFFHHGTLLSLLPLRWQLPNQWRGDLLVTLTGKEHVLHTGQSSEPACVITSTELLPLLKSAPSQSLSGWNTPGGPLHRTSKDISGQTLHCSNTLDMRSLKTYLWVMECSVWSHCLFFLLYSFTPVVCVGLSGCESLNRKLEQCLILNVSSFVNQQLSNVQHWWTFIKTFT